jgi:alkanesulfonate monooxygenase SsuD/methylene tetrahydromethanopterin reductase-like flavin-dependent oxidoreductase (luciferase family)
MPGLGGFRFATASFENTRAGVLAEARMAERLGYDTFVMAGHRHETLGSLPTLMMVAEPVGGLRLGSCGLCTDVRHPAVMSTDAAALDVLNGGRFRPGLEAGCQPPESGTTPACLTWGYSPTACKPSYP